MSYFDNIKIVGNLPPLHSIRCAIFDPTPDWCDCGAVQRPVVLLSDVYKMRSEYNALREELKRLKLNAK